MANVDRPFGLRPVKHLKGGPWNGQTHLCYIPSTDSTRAFFIGDAVIMGGTADSTGFRPTVTIATPGANGAIFGVITGFAENPDLLSLTYRLDDTGRYCFVCIDPDVIYEIQDNGGATDLVAIGIAAVGLNANLVAGTGSTTSSLAGTCLNADATTADGTYQLLILAASSKVDNDATLPHAVWEVLIAQHQLRACSSADAVGFNILGT